MEGTPGVATRRFVCWREFVSILFVICLAARSAEAQEDKLIRAVVDGKQTSLYEKVVVTSGKASIVKRPGQDGNPVEPFAIFFKLKTPSGGREQSGYVLVGDSYGRPFGWIKREDVTDWNTRFILEPTQPVPGRAFAVDLGGGNEAQLKTVPEGKRRFALITSTDDAKSEDEETYQVVVYAGNVQTAGMAGTLSRERNKLRDLKLEIMFVIEPTDFMLWEFGEQNVWDSVKAVMTQCVDLIQKRPELKGAVRLGLAEYQDVSADAKFDSRLTSPLTDRSSDFLQALERVDPIPINGDWPESVLAGLLTAVDKGGWTSNSSKHVILIGSASAQTAGRGQQPSQFGGEWNSATNGREDFGWNSTGMSISQLVGRAHPQTGSVEEKARNAKTFHTVLVGKDLPKLPADQVQLVNSVVRASDADLNAMAERLDVEMMMACFQYYLVNYQRDLARSNHAELARNDGVAGLRLETEPSQESIERAARQLAETLTESFTTLAGVRDGRIGTKELEQQSGAISQTFYAIVGAAADKFKDLPVLTGNSSTRDQRGREVAHRKVLVSMQELQRLRSTLDAIHKKFAARVAKVDRQDVSTILDELKQVTASTTAGQATFAAGVRLKDVITDLPLRTNALDTTPRDLAVMPSDAFKQWLNKLETSIFRAEDLLNGKAEWLELSSLAENDKFTFVRLTELP